MMQSKNKVLISAAGSGKTTYIVKEALSKIDKKVLLLTYTNDNLNEIKKKIVEFVGVIPKNIKIQSWFSFLLNDGVRPYQNFLYDEKRIESIEFKNYNSTRYIRKTDIKRYYLASGKYIYTDKISLFITECNQKSNGAVIKRLEKMYGTIFIDEVQDLAAYDFDILQLLFKSKISMYLVGDNRQETFKTNNSIKYSKYKGDVRKLFIEWEAKKLCSINYRTISYRCNQDICDLADSLYKDMERTKSGNSIVTEHDGVYIVREKDLNAYLEKYRPQVLRYNKTTIFESESVLNFGTSKGLTFDRVLIIPNKKMKEFLRTGDYSYLEASKAKYYVALTRARYSLAVLYDGECKVNNYFKIYN